MKQPSSSDFMISRWMSVTNLHVVSIVARPSDAASARTDGATPCAEKTTRLSCAFAVCELVPGGNAEPGHFALDAFVVHDLPEDRALLALLGGEADELVRDAHAGAETVLLGEDDLHQPPFPSKSTRTSSGGSAFTSRSRLISSKPLPPRETGVCRRVIVCSVPLPFTSVRVARLSSSPNSAAPTRRSSGASLKPRTPLPGPARTGTSFAGNRIARPFSDARATRSFSSHTKTDAISSPFAGFAKRRPARVVTSRNGSSENLRTRPRRVAARRSTFFSGVSRGSREGAATTRSPSPNLKTFCTGSP